MHLRLANMILSAGLALAPLAASADLAPLATDELRAVNGQGGTLIYNPPPPVKRLDHLSAALDRYGLSAPRRRSMSSRGSCISSSPRADAPACIADLWGFRRTPRVRRNRSGFTLIGLGIASLFPRYDIGHNRHRAHVS